MKRIGLLVIGLALSVGTLVRAQPPVGTWNSDSGSFPAGSWTETLLGGGEGMPGNVIAAQSSNVYAFGGAVLERATLVEETGTYRKYETVYTNGTLRLANTNGVPWYHAGDGPYEAAFDAVLVQTFKYIQNGQETGETAFYLTGKGDLAGYPTYTAAISAFFQGQPGLSGGTTPTNPVVISGDLNNAKISIMVPLAFAIKPGSSPCPLNVKSKGVLPAVLYGTPAVPICRIRPETIRLIGEAGSVAPIRWGKSDAGKPGGSTRPDRIKDLTLKFDTQAVVGILGPVTDEEIVTLLIGATLDDGTELTGQTIVRILKKGQDKTPKDKDARVQKIR
jgi:hypothetical protein